LKPAIKVAFASGTGELNRQLIERMRALFPELPLYVVADFPPEDAGLRWVPYRVNGSLGDNLARCREAFRGHRIRLAAVMLVPNVPFRRMRLMALLLSPLGFLAFNENLNNFMLRPRSAPAILRHIAWRVTNALRWSIRAARRAAQQHQRGKRQRRRQNPPAIQALFHHCFVSLFSGSLGGAGIFTIFS